MRPKRYQQTISVESVAIGGAAFVAVLFLWLSSRRLQQMDVP
ncbi:uncharacterized protein METZ01_LOCUS31666 [marine metagenome]|uniref:Uncharacterized protein n=1 Tax=marine metagenome TaxID=408172 RepID=A0A381QHI6_9ZZZZ|nr:hypothetical protein [Chloroflexota bacterium]